MRADDYPNTFHKANRYSYGPTFTEPEITAVFQQKYGRNPTPQEIQAVSSIDAPAGHLPGDYNTLRQTALSRAIDYTVGTSDQSVATIAGQPTSAPIAPAPVGTTSYTPTTSGTTSGTGGIPVSTQYTTPAPTGYATSTIPIGASPSATSNNPFLAPQDTRPALPTLAPDDKAGPFGIPSFRSYYEKANKALDAYYQRVLAEEYGDVDRAIARLREDYDRGVRITMEDYTTNLAYAQESANAARMEEAATAKKENRALTGNLLSRGVYEGGLAESQKGELQSAQDLRREAIDRALRKSETDLGFTKERGLEEATRTQKRGTEDTASNWQKFQTAKQMEREEKALGLAEVNYGREFSAVSTQKSFELAQEGLKLQREAMGK